MGARVYFYLNRRINANYWEAKFFSRDLASLQLRIKKEKHNSTKGNKEI